jgi:hypothetical protein
MNNIIEPNTEVEILSLEHLAYVKKLAEEQGYKRWSCINLADNETRYVAFHSDMEFTQNVYACYLDKFKRVTLPMPDTPPKPPFKLRNANHPAVRQWLKGQGYDFWQSNVLNILTTHLDYSFGIVDEEGYFYVLSGEDYFDQEDAFNKHTFPELTLNLAVTSWEMPEPIDSAKLERMERIKAIEAELDKLKQMDA